MSTAKRVIKNTGFLYAKMGITMFISLYTTRLVLNALGASDFGIFNIVGGAIAMLGFLNAAMASATQRFMSYSEGEGDKEKQKKIFNISFVLHFFIAFLLGLVLLICGYFFFNGVLNIEPSRIYAAKVVYGSLIISTLFTIMSVPYDAVLNARENMLYYSIVGIIESILKLFVALAVVYFAGDKLIMYGVLMALIPLITMTIMRVYCHKHYVECVIAPKKYWDKKLGKEMGIFAGWNFLNNSSGMVSQYGMGIVLNSFFGTVVNAAQGIANQISGQLMTFSQVILKAINPVITKSEGGNNRELAVKIAFYGCKVSFILFAIFSIPFIIETPFILKVWLNNIPDWAIIFCRLQLLRILIEQLTISLGSMISAQGDVKKYYQIKSLFNILPILLAFLFFSFGLAPYMLYVGWILCYSIIGGFISIYFAKIKCNINYAQYYKHVLFPCILIAFISFVGGYIINSFFSEGFFRLFLVSAYCILMICCLTFSILLSKQERDNVISYIKKLVIRNKKKYV